MERKLCASRAVHSSEVTSVRGSVCDAMKSFGDTRNSDGDVLDDGRFRGGGIDSLKSASSVSILTSLPMEDKDDWGRWRG